MSSSTLPLAPGNLNAALSVGGRPQALHDKNLEGLDPGAQQFLQTLPQEYRLDRQIQDRLAAIGQKLAAARRPVIVCGTDVVRESTPALAADLARLLREAGLKPGYFTCCPAPTPSARRCCRRPTPG